MKNLFLILVFLASALFAEPGETVVGQRVVRQSLVTWNAGTNLLKTRLLRLNSSLYSDTSTTGQAGQWKRIDNTSDSCSNPFPLVSDTNGSIRPIWEFRIWETVRSVDKDSSTHQYRIATRERVYDGSTRISRWTPWTIPKKNSGYASVTILDTVVVPNVSTTAKAAQYVFGFVAGSWARLCPDKVVGTATAAGDSIFSDSTQVYSR